MYGCRFSALLLLLTLLTCSYTRAADFPLLQKVAGVADAGLYDVIVDTRPLASCRQSSLQQAKCLPVEDLLAPQGRLANWSGILWLLGSAGLSGTEHILVTGQLPARRDFIAGLLVLAGQHRVTVAEQAVTEMTAANDRLFAGSVRATTRTSVYTAAMRSDLIVLRSDLKTWVTGDSILLDGRSESEYYGASVRASRGGHIPGAMHSPLSDWRSDPARNAALFDISNSDNKNPVVYAHDTFDSLVYFTAVLAAGVMPKVYLSGWVEWANDSALAVDSVSYPIMASAGKAPVVTTDNAASPATYHIGKTALLAAAVSIVAMFVYSFYAGRKSAKGSA